MNEKAPSSSAQCPSESEEMFRQMADNAPVLIWMSGVDTLCTWVNNAWLNFTGRTIEQELGNGWTDNIHPDDFDKCAQVYTSNFDRKTEFKMEYRLRRHDGEYRWIVDTGAPRFSGQGEFCGYIGSCVDIHERKRESDEISPLNAELHEREAQLRKIADTLPQIIWVARPDGFRELFNKRWYEFIGDIGRKSEDFGWYETIYPEDRELADRIWNHSLSTGEPYHIEYRRRRHDGVFRWFLGRALPLRNAQGEIEKWYGTSTDIHEQKIAEEARDHLLAQEKNIRIIAEREGLLKDEFLATLSHELRTPLNAILGWAQLLKRPNSSKEQIEKGLEIIERNSRAQSQLIDDLLDMNRIAAGKLRLDLRKINLNEVIEAALTSIAPTAEAKGISVFPLATSSIFQIMGDPGRIQQILWNLLTNAVKFTPRGGMIEVTLKKIDGHVEILVTDSGVGISSDFIHHVFDRFRQADATTTRRHGGLGLGLAIAKNLTEMHGGEIKVSSPGEKLGSTFTLSLPIAANINVDNDVDNAPIQKEMQGNPPSAAIFLDGIEILIVDDERDSREVVKRIFEDSRAQVFVSGSVDEALTILSHHKVDIIVSDIGMPTRDGYDLMKHIRHVEAQTGILDGIPAIALTAFARAEDKTRALLAGYQAHIAKPIDSYQLLLTVKKLTSRGFGQDREGSAIQ